MLESTSTTYTVTIPEALSGERADKALSQLLPELSRSRLQALIEAGQVSGVTGPSSKVKAAQVVTITLPPIERLDVIATDIPLDIIFEDAHFLIINKPAGMTVHPAPGHYDDTLVNALLAHCGDSLSGIGGVARPGIVHRLDKDTSGLIAVAKNDAAHASLASQLKSRTLKRTYLALVKGVPTPAIGTITGHIGRSPKNRQKMAVLKTGGREAVTHYTVLERFGDKASLVECRLETGRTHQIRVHMSHIGHSLLGDPVYGRGASSFPRQALHAAALVLIHPDSAKEMQFSAPLPDDMKTLLDEWRSLHK